MSNPSNSMISISQIESDIIGLKVARFNCATFDPKDLHNELVRNRFDLCRLKTPSENEYAVSVLQQMGLPFFFSGSIRKYRTRIADNPNIHYLHNNLVFEMYDGTQDLLLKDMLKKTWGTYPIGYYRSPYLDTLIGKETELECVYQYYKKYNNNIEYPMNKIMFMKDGDKYIGVFTLNQTANVLECNLAGILPEYRSGGYFHDEMNFKKEYCIKHGIEFFTFGARNENASVQRIFQHLNFQTIGTDNVFHISPLLSHTINLPIIKSFNLSNYTKTEVCSLLQKEATTLINQKTIIESISFKVCGLDALSLEPHTEIQFTFPVLQENKQLIVLKSTDENNPFVAHLSVNT